MDRTSGWTALRAAGVLTCTLAAPTLNMSPMAQAAAAGDSAAVHALWSSVDAAWNARDAEQFSGLLTEDVSLEFVDRGEALESRTAVFEHFAEQFPGFAPELRHRTDVRQVLAIAPDILGVDSRVEILRVAPEASAEPTVLRTFAVFAVMARNVEGLRIRALRIYQLPAAGDHAEKH